MKIFMIYFLLFFNIFTDENNYEKTKECQRIKQILINASIKKEELDFISSIDCYKNSKEIKMELFTQQKNVDDKKSKKNK